MGNNTQGGRLPKSEQELRQLALNSLPDWLARRITSQIALGRKNTQITDIMVKATSSRTNLDWDTNSQTIDIKQYFPRS